MDQSPLITINNRHIGDKYPPYIIAELSANHNGSLETAIRLVERAKATGADAIKIQTYTPDTITLNSTNDDFLIKDGLWAGKTLYDLYEEAHMPWEWHKPLYEKANELDITIFSTPFDETAVDFLEDLNTPAYKIASFEAIDLPLIRYVAGTGKPLIISTGMANSQEIGEAIEAAREGGCSELAILHCVSGYPAPSYEYNLFTLVDMMKRFGIITGLSDHTIENTTAIASVALGACIIEKHFTLDRSGGGPDDSFSLEPEDFSKLCKKTLSTWQTLGKVNYEKKSSEKENLKFRRSLYFVKDLNAGDIISSQNVRSIRPGFGMAPKNLPNLIGKSVSRNIKSGTPVLSKYLTKLR